MAEWLYEEGIGENRAALVEGGQILEAAIELPGEPVDPHAFGIEEDGLDSGR